MGNKPSTMKKVNFEDIQYILTNNSLLKWILPNNSSITLDGNEIL